MREPTWANIVADWGYDILRYERVGSYSGDIVALLWSSDKGYGLAVIGYGSCSGCDVLQSVISDIEPDDEDAPVVWDWRACPEIIALSEDRRSAIHWEPDEPTSYGGFLVQMLAHENRDDNQWWYHDAEVHRFLSRALDDWENEFG